jgi:putative hydrolase of the HAD superfamily
MAKPTAGARSKVWLFDLDNTLHNASHHVFGALNVAMTDFIERELRISRDEANALRGKYWLRYGATLLGLVRHHGVGAAHFLAETHALPGLEAHVHTHAHDLAALKRLRGRKYILTNAPAAYAARVLARLGMARLFDGMIAVEQMRMFGQLRPKPDRRLFKHLAARLRVPAGRCVLVEDTLEHQKSARAAGMQTVWMQRWARRGQHSTNKQVRMDRKPAYVDRRVRTLRTLEARG